LGRKRTAVRRAARREKAQPSDWSPAEPLVGLPEGMGAGKPSIDQDKRLQDRISQRELGVVDMSVRFRNGPWRKVRLWDFSSIGFGITYGGPLALHEPILGRPDPELPGRSRDGDFPIAVGDQVEVRIKVRAHLDFEAWCTVKNLSRSRDGLKIGLRRQDIGFPQMAGAERRGSHRLSLLPNLSLAARTRHPFLYARWCTFRVSDLNQDLGFSFLSSDPSLLLFEGLVMDIHFELAAFRGLPIRARVTWVHATQAAEVRFGVECLEMDWRLHKGISAYLLYSRNFTPNLLRSTGFRIHQVKSHLRFRSVKSMEEYADVLRLRRDAYVGAGKRPESTAPEDMATPLDGSSRILMARHQGRLVGTMTFTFPAAEETILDSQASFPGRKYPVPLPPKANLIEVSRLCIHEEYRGTDLLQGMFEHGLKHFLLSDRHWLLTSATDELAPMYERIGFTRLKASYPHALLNGKEHHLLIVHRSAFLWGFGIGLLTWNSVFADLVEYLLDRRLLKLPGWMRIAIQAKLLCRPLARRLTDAAARRAFRKHMASLRTRRDSSRAADRKSLRHLEISGPGSLYQEMEVDVPGSAAGSDEPRASAGSD
jgi:hypothetical protein